MTTEITMPQMGVSVAEGTVVEWKKQVGDWVEADEVIASISTDKIDTDVEAPAAGRLQEIVVAVGETVDVGTVLALIATDAKPGEAHTSEGTSEADAALEAPGEAGALQGDAERPQPRRYSPVVMRMAAEHDIDLSPIEGTGRGGRVRKQDVLAYLENGASTAEPPMHIESPYKPDEPAAPKKRQPRFTREPDEPAPRRRRPRAAARSRACASRSGGRWSSRSRPPRRARRSSRPTCPASTRRARRSASRTCRSSPARRSRRCASSRRSTRRSRARRSRRTRACTSASRSRSARAA